MSKLLLASLQLGFGTAFYLSASPLLAQVTSDGTVNTQINQNENVAEITGGETRGSNLFHSFQDFSVQTGNEAFFNNGDSIANIFSRVTGGNISNIDGLIRANDTNLFLINPAGILFGENARLDIGGSFYGSTADSILFEDGEFSAVDNLQQPVLTINAPIGLSFRDAPGDIVNRSFAQNDLGDFTGLEVASGQTLALVGGDINFEAGEATASGGNIYLGGLAKAGIVEFNEDGSLSFPQDVTLADITLTNNAIVDVTGTGGGSVTVDARNLTLETGDFGRSIIIAGITSESTNPEAQAGDITINVAENISLNDTLIINQVDSESVGNSGNIIINTGSLELVNGGQVDASTFGTGNAGVVDVTATGDITADGENSLGFPSGITSGVNFGAEGKSGGVTISTTNLNLTNGGRVSANTLGFGNAGAINVTATGDITADGENSLGFSSGITSGVNTGAKGNSGGVTITTANLNLTNGGIVDGNTSGLGDAGTVNITATGDIATDGENSLGFPSSITSFVNPSAEGDAGGVTISTANLNLTAGGQVSASTFGTGNAGAVNVIATGDITTDGEDSGGSNSGITSLVNPSAEGDAGGVTISTANLNLTAGGRVSTDTLGTGNAGAVNVTATGDITVDGEDSEGFVSGITSLVNTGAEGKSGGVTISTANLNLTNGGRVSASTFGAGNAGAVNVTATGDITAEGEDLDGFPSGITSFVNTGAEGNAGGVTISTANLNLTNGGRVSASTFGFGNASDVNITASESISIDGVIERFRSSISANALNENGNGGDIFIDTGNLTIANGGTIEVTNFVNIGGDDIPGTGQPGNINITANSIELVDSARIEAATQFLGEDSGIINLNVTEDITLRDNSFISAQAFDNADGGNLNIDARYVIAFPSVGTGNDLIATADDGTGGVVDLLDVEAIFGLQPGDAVSANNQLIRNNTNDIDASSNIPGQDGTVALDPGSLNPIQGATELLTNIALPEETAQQACRGNGEIAAQNSFSVGGKGGIIPEPGLPLNSSNIYVDGENDSASSIPAPVETAQGKIQLARGVKVTESGEVILTAYRTNNAGERIPPEQNCDRVTKSF